MDRAPGESPVRVEPVEGGACWRVTIAGSKGNILDARVMAVLNDLFLRASKTPELKAITIEGEGSHFSFGASVAEHLPDQVGAMLSAFHELVRNMVDSAVVLIAVVRGRCLGGGLELASLCHRVYASPEATLGQPEIRLGVFPPVASVILPERIGRARAEDLCLTGRTISTEEALQIGLVDGVAEEPAQLAQEYIREFILPSSAVSLRHAVKALRVGLRQRLGAELDQVERLYLDSLMGTHDAVEGIRAFLEKRKPQWSDT